MSRLLLALLMGAASTACAFAALGWTLYAAQPQAAWVAQCFGAWGALAGLGCGLLHLHAHGRPAQAPAALPPDEIAGLVRAALASAVAERSARPGSAADRRPAGDAPAPLAPAAAVAAAAAAVQPAAVAAAGAPAAEEVASA